MNEDSRLCIDKVPRFLFTMEQELLSYYKIDINDEHIWNYVYQRYKPPNLSNERIQAVFDSILIVLNKENIRVRDLDFVVDEERSKVTFAGKKFDSLLKLVEIMRE